MHKIEEVRHETLAYFNGDNIAANVWIDKYCLKDKDLNLMEKSPDDMHKRISNHIARIENKYPNPMSFDKIYGYLKDFKYIIPGGSILFGTGNDYAYSSLGNCFVIGNESDSYGGICAIDEEQIQLMKRRAGVGIDISHLRPKNASVRNSAKTSTGAVSFMPRISSSTREVAQDGRRGASMITIHINHPDSGEFIVAKDDKTKITGSNVSVKITDEFMACVLQDQIYQLRFPVDSDPKDAKYVLEIKAKKLWDSIVHQAWKSAEPGCLFIDTIRRESPADCYSNLGYKTISTNPCGEIPLCPYDSCRLLSIILPSFVVNKFTDKAYFDFDLFRKTAYDAQRMMDDIVDLEEEKIDAILNKISNDPEPDEIKQREIKLWLKIKEKLVNGRRTGLSAIGLADTLAMLGLSYTGNDEFVVKIYKELAVSAYMSSIDMGNERGTFPIWNEKLELNNPFLSRILEALPICYQSKQSPLARRNIALLTNPPSGTIAMMAQITSGIEPVFRPFYKRKRKVTEEHPNKSFKDDVGDWWEEYNIAHKGLIDYLLISGKISNPKDISLMSESEIKDLVASSPYVNSASNEIDPMLKIEMVGKIQKWIDHAISQTVNLPKDTKEEFVSKMFIHAWKHQLKGITCYVDGSRDGVLNESGHNSRKEVFMQHDAPPRPKTLTCDCKLMMVSGKEFIVCVGLFDNKPYEVFAFENKYNVFLKNKLYKGFIAKIKGGSYDLSIPGLITIPNITGEMTQAEEDRTRLISTSLRHGTNVKFLIEQLYKSKNVDITSFSRAIARMLKAYVIDTNQSIKEKCPACGAPLKRTDGCVSCSDNCGFSKCE